MQKSTKEDENKQNNIKLNTPKKMANNVPSVTKSPIKTPMIKSKYYQLNYQKTKALECVKSKVVSNIMDTKNIEKSLLSLEYPTEKKLLGQNHSDNNIIKEDSKDEAISPLAVKGSYLRQNINKFNKQSAGVDQILTDSSNCNKKENYDTNRKKKKEWISWSTQEKELFYEAIANGGNYSSLQKLFKNMNDVKNYLLYIFRKLVLNQLKKFETIITEL